MWCESASPRSTAANSAAGTSTFSTPPSQLPTRLATCRQNLRRTLLDLEPETIANRFAQQDLVLEGISEGIVALDNQHRITMLNSAAFYQLRLPGTGRHALLGRSLAALAPGLVPTLQHGGAGRLTAQGYALGGD